jgi:ubiquitin C-terminal hydrolase
MELINVEQKLNDINSKTLLIECNTFDEKYNIFNITNWLKVSNTYDLSKLPNNYFNIAYWFNCDLESEFKRIYELYPKMTIGGTIYFNNFITGMSLLIKKCIPNDVYISPHIYKYIVDTTMFKVDIIKVDNQKDLLYSLTKVAPKISQMSEKIIDSRLEIKSNEPPIMGIPIELNNAFKNYGGFSCYMDSILFGILSSDNYITRNIFTENEPSEATKKYCSNVNDINEYINSIKNTISNLKQQLETDTISCYPLISQLKKCNTNVNKLLSGDQQDDSEFLITFMNIFDLKPTLINNKKYVSNDNENWLLLDESNIRTNILTVNLPELPNDYELLSLYQKENIIDYSSNPSLGPKKDNIVYQYLKEKNSIIESNTLIFHIGRYMYNSQTHIYEKNTIPIEFEEFILEKPDKYFELYIVTVHSGGLSGGHYTSYIKNNGRWYHYDDIESNDKLRLVAWDVMYKRCLRNSSLLVYYPI